MRISKGNTPELTAPATHPIKLSNRPHVRFYKRRIFILEYLGVITRVRDDASVVKRISKRDKFFVYDYRRLMPLFGVNKRGIPAKNHTCIAQIFRRGENVIVSLGIVNSGSHCPKFRTAGVKHSIINPWLCGAEILYLFYIFGKKKRRITAAKLMFRPHIVE